MNGFGFYGCVGFYESVFLIFDEELNLVFEVVYNVIEVIVEMFEVVVKIVFIVGEIEFLMFIEVDVVED